MADLRIAYSELMVGANHPTKADTLNRLPLAEHNNDGTHKAPLGNFVAEHNSDGTHSKLTKVIDPWVDVRAFGAKGDGTTDDTAAIQAAVTAGQMVWFPAGTYLITNAITLANNTSIRGVGDASVIKTVSLPGGGTGIGMRMLDGSGKTNFRIEKIKLDAGGITTFVAGMRCILCSGSSYYDINDVTFVTPGAATASIGSSYYRVSNCHVTVSATTGAAHHDGVIDQWGGSHHFTIFNNTILGGGIAKYPILVTGEDTANAAAPCYSFLISHNKVYSTKIVGIWVNGRKGVNYDFHVANNIVDSVTDYYGLAVSDSRRFCVSGNVVRTTGINGMRFYNEVSTGATFSCAEGLINDNVVDGANVLGSTSIIDGSAITVADACNGLSVSHNRVSGTTHRYAVALAGTTYDNEVSGSNYATGVVGLVYNVVASNRVPGGSTYTPTLTAVANVSASIAYQCRYIREGNVVRITGELGVTPTAAGGTTTQLGISLPIASNFTSVQVDAAGVANDKFRNVTGAISADTTNDRLELQFPAQNTASNGVYFMAEYTVN